MDLNRKKLIEYKEKAYNTGLKSDFVTLRFHVIKLIKQAETYNHLRAIINEIYLDLTEKFKTIRNKDVIKISKGKKRRNN